MSEYKSSLGSIIIQKNIMHDIIINAINLTDGRAKLGNFKLRVGFLVNDPNNCIKYDWEDNVLSIELFVIVQFGYSISKVADKIADNICTGCDETLGISPSSIKVIVTATESGGKLIRRDIEIERTR